jgi:hypothetical protein
MKNLIPISATILAFIAAIVHIVFNAVILNTQGDTGLFTLQVRNFLVPRSSANFLKVYNSTEAKRLTVGYKRACLELPQEIQCVQVRDILSLIDKVPELELNRLQDAFSGSMPDLVHLFNVGGAMTMIFACICLCLFLRLPYEQLRSRWWLKYAIIAGLFLMLVPAYWAVIYIIFVVLQKVKSIFPAFEPGKVETLVFVDATCATVAWMLCIAGLGRNIEKIDMEEDELSGDEMGLW